MNASAKRAMQLAKECAHKMATPANWHALQSHLEQMCGDEVAARLLAWSTEQISAGYEIGRYRDGHFEPLMLAEAIEHDRSHDAPKADRAPVAPITGRSTTACDDQDAPEPRE